MPAKQSCAPPSDYFLAVGGRMRISRKISRSPDDGSITADLHRIREDDRASPVMERAFRYWL